jgi:hypothetical protein
MTTEHTTSFEPTMTTEPTEPTEPTELTVRLSYPSGSEHQVTIQRNHDLGLALKAVDEGGHDETGTVLIRLGVDGYEVDKVLIDHRSAVDMLEVVGQAREALETLTTALVRLRRS